MAIDPMQRLLEIQIQQRLCQMHSSDFANVTGWELNPLIWLLQTIKEEYQFRKPEVYKTVVAVLNDYKPICGEKHREKTVRYLKLLLCCNPELADYVASFLPPAVNVSAQYSHCLQSANARSCNGLSDKRADESSEASPTSSNAGAISSLTAAHHLRPSLPLTTSSNTPTNAMLLWPFAVHASMQPRTLAPSTSRSISPPGTTAHQYAARAPVTAATQSVGGYSGLGPRRLVAVTKGLPTSLKPIVSAPGQSIYRVTGGKAGTVPRWLVVVRPATGSTSAVIVRTPNTQTVTGIGKPALLENAAAPAVRSSIRPILLPRVIARPTFSVAASVAQCRVVQAKTVTVPQQQVTTKTKSPAASLADENTGRDSPLSCIQTLVANAGAAPTQWIAGISDDNNKVPPGSSQSESVTSDESNVTLCLSVSSDNKDDNDNADDKQASCYVSKWQLSESPSEEAEIPNKAAKLS